MHKRVADDLSLRITNFCMDAEADRAIFDEIYEKSGAKKCVQESVRLIGTHQDLSRYTHAQLEEKYRGMIVSFVDTRTEAVEFMTLLAALDLKVSHVVALLEEEAGKYPLKLGELEQLVYNVGFCAMHKFYITPGLLQEEESVSAKVPKPKRVRGNLRLIK